MTIIKPLSLNALEKQSFKEKIQEKVTGMGSFILPSSQSDNEVDIHKYP
ncbi:MULTISPECIES: hypothetical protein [Bacillaceae]|nr:MULTISPECIES: hypothetical protein [Bacillaceae]MCF7624231.1 hypothetical protein [Peribacillus frigoritolerans]MEA3577100.1 hypothetical protein [Peribacillus frigoritolerans]